MKLLFLFIALTSSPLHLLLAQSGVQQDPTREPENLAETIERLIRYHDYGFYDYQVRQVANAAREYLRERLKSRSADDKFAAVFDIDETALSNWERLRDCNFCPFDVQDKLYSGQAKDPAIAPVLELYRFAQQNGVYVFFVTGRREKGRKATEKELMDAGYSGWQKLYMRPNGNSEPANIVKPRSRTDIEQQGYRIVLNVGDQASDLAGCCAERVFKLPNPFYLVE